MHVGVEEAVAQRVGQEELQDPLAERHAGRCPAASMRGDVAQRRCPRPSPASSPGAPTGCQIDRRHPEARRRSRCWRANSAAAAASMPQVELAHAPRPRNALITSVGRSRRRRARQQLDHAGGEVEGVDVAQEGALDPRAQHLDRDILRRSSRSARAVHLRDRGGGDRARRSRRRRASTGCAKLGLDRRRAPRPSGKGGSLSCSTRQLVGELGADHVGPGRQQLAELDVGRAQRGQRPRSPAAAPDRPRSPATGTASRAPAPTTRSARRRVASPPAPRVIAPVRSKVAPVRISRQMLCGPAHLRSSSPNAARRRPSTGCDTSPGRSPAARIIAAKRLLIGEAADRFDQILIAVAVAGHDLAQRRDDVEGIAVIEPLQRRRSAPG